jgi:phosphocarrier protein
MSGSKNIHEKATQAFKELEILNSLGIHARPAAMFVKIATKFKSQVFVEKDGERVNGKSIMGLLMLAAGPGSRIRIYADGPDANKAIEELEALITNKFGEE